MVEEYEGCAAFDANYSHGCRAHTERYASTKTVNTIRFAAPSPILREIFQLSEVAYELPGFCRSLAAANHSRVLRFYDLAPVDDGVEVCGAAPAAWTTKKNGVTYACRVLGFERDRPGCVDRLLARMRATAPGDRHTPGCGLFKRGARGRPPP